MKGLLQRVSGARVEVAETSSGYRPGFAGVAGGGAGRYQAQADKLLKKLLNYRVFSDPQAR
ncbi:D-aminoacyl-tRNA deacylase [Pseudomonas sp. PCH446]